MLIVKRSESLAFSQTTKWGWIKIIAVFNISLSLTEINYYLLSKEKMHLNLHANYPNFLVFSARNKQPDKTHYLISSR